MKIQNGDLPANPTIYADLAQNGQRELYCNESGLTKREEFVRSFIQGLLSNSGGPIQASHLSGFNFCNTDIQGVVNLAIEIADCALNTMENTK
jgi:hypothetical protein